MCPVPSVLLTGERHVFVVRRVQSRATGSTTWLEGPSPGPNPIEGALAAEEGGGEGGTPQHKQREEAFCAAERQCADVGG